MTSRKHDTDESSHDRSGDAARTRPPGRQRPGAYAIAHLRETVPHPEVADYIERVSGTFEPFGGEFLVHGAAPEVKEGEWPGHVVIIGFPGIDQARAWWDSPGYRRIAPMRSRHVRGDIVVVPGVPDGYDPADTAAMIRADADRQPPPPAPQERLPGQP